MADLSWLQAVASGFVGGSFPVIGQYLRGKQDADTQSRLRRDERKQVRSDRRLEFEIRELHALREKLAAAVGEARAIRRVADEMEFYEGDGSPAYEDGRDGPYLAASRTLEEQIPVVMYDPVRQRLTAFLEELRKYTYGGDYNAFEQACTECQEAIGARMRALHGDDSWPAE